MLWQILVHGLVISIVDKKIDTANSITVPNSIITLFREINDAVMQTGAGQILESVLQDFIAGRKVAIPDKVKGIIVSKLKNFAQEIEGDAFGKRF